MVEHAWRFQSPTLIIEPATANDAKGLFALLSHRGMTFADQPPKNVAEVRSWFPPPMDSPWWVLRRSEGGAVIGRLAVELLDLGEVGFRFLEVKAQSGDEVAAQLVEMITAEGWAARPRIAELTLHIHPDEQGNGHGTLAVSECSAFLEGRGWNVMGKIHESNPISPGLARKVGAQETAMSDAHGFTYWV